MIPLRKQETGRETFSTGYGLNTDRPIELLSIAYRYPGNVVFGLPHMTPALGWEVGNSGAAVRKTNYTPTRPFTMIRFYPDGFGPIGG